MLRKVGVNHRLAIVDICRMQANDGALISNSNLVGASSSDTR